MIHRARSYRSVATAVAGALIPLVLAAPAIAAPTNAKVGSGALTITAVSVADFPGTTLDGKAKAVNATMADFSVNDARGKGFGWNVTVQATQFAQWDPTANSGSGGYVAGGRTLAANSLEMPTPAVTADGTTSTAPSVMPGPHRIDTTGAVKIASAAPDTGMGKYNFTLANPLKLTVPANAYAVTYRSSVTMDVVSGP